MGIHFWLFAEGLFSYFMLQVHGPCGYCSCYSLIWRPQAWLTDSVHSTAHSGTRSIDLVPLWAAELTESGKHIKLIGLKTITMKKNNYDQAKRKTCMESVKFPPFWLFLVMITEAWKAGVRPKAKKLERMWAQVPFDLGTFALPESPL